MTLIFFLNQQIKVFLTFSLLIFGTYFVYADNKADVCKAYLTNDLILWKSTIDKLENQQSKTDAIVLELLNYYYGYISRCIKVKKMEEAELCLEKANNHVKSLENKSVAPGFVNLYKSAFWGYEISFSNYKAPLLSGKITDAAKSAIKADKNNPLCYIQYGHTEYYKPSSFGGSKTLALANYLKALQLMEKNQTDFLGDWNYLNLLACIGRTYLALDNNNMAKSFYDKALKIAPDFWWINTELYPKLKTQ